MGLDNGIILHSKVHIPAETRPGMISYLGVDETNMELPHQFDVCYWRKCGNIRREVAHALHLPLDYVQKYDMSIEDVKLVWYVITELNSERIWNDGDSIWFYSEIEDHLNDDLTALEWLIHFMRTHKDDEYMVEFYDSY